MIEGQMTVYDVLNDIDKESQITYADRYVLKVVSLMRQGGNPDEEFYYLGGPMSRIPGYNFPAFDAAAANLRAKGYNIVSPAELEDPATREAHLASPDGMEHDHGIPVAGGKWADFLGRDLIICSMPTCIGGIFLENWEHSRGARLESYVLSRLGKPLFKYGIHEHYPISRDTALVVAGIKND